MPLLTATKVRRTEANTTKRYRELERILDEMGDSIATEVERLRDSYDNIAATSAFSRIPGERRHQSMYRQPGQASRRIVGLACGTAVIAPAAGQACRNGQGVTRDIDGTRFRLFPDKAAAHCNGMQDIGTVPHGPHDWPVAAGLRSPSRPGIHQPVRHNWFPQAYARSIAGCVGIGVLAAVFYAATTDRVYTATTQILIEPKLPQLLQQQAAEVNLSLDTAQVESQLAVMRSEKIAMMVIDELKLLDDEKFNRKGPTLVGRFGKFAAIIGEALGSGTAEPSQAETAAADAAVPANGYGLPKTRVSSAAATRCGLSRRGSTFVAKVSPTPLTSPSVPPTRRWRPRSPMPQPTPISGNNWRPRPRLPAKAVPGSNNALVNSRHR